MEPFKFPQFNVRYGPPEGLEESQVRTIWAWHGQCGGSCDGLNLVVVAYKPTPEEIAHIVSGKPIFISQLGGLAPHFLSTSFEQATNPA